MGLHIGILGLLIDTVKQVVCLPVDKIQRAIALIDYFLNTHNKKATVLQFQKLCGVLNFLCKCIIPGRVFTRRLYERTAGSHGHLKSHYHVRITNENRSDLKMWRAFLTNPEVFCRPYMNITLHTDNKSVRDMINANSSGCKNCMVLLRLIVLEVMLRNTKISAVYVKSAENGKADVLSRLDFKRFRQLGPDMEVLEIKVPECIWPVQKIWLN